MVWRQDLFLACYELGWKGKTNTLMTQLESSFIKKVLHTKENFTFSELEKIEKDKNIYIEITEDKFVEHTKISVIFGIIESYNAGVEFKSKSKK